MGKISLYKVIPTQPQLSDMLIGTNVTDANLTQNFQLSQILSLYPQITQKANVYSDVNQNAPAINTPTLITFNNSQFVSSSFLRLPSGGPTYNGFQIGNSGYYMIQAFVNYSVSAATGEISVWLKVNSLDIGPAQVKAIQGYGYQPIVMTWILNLSAADILSLVWQVSASSISLSAISASGSRPAVPSVQILISQV